MRRRLSIPAENSWGAILGAARRYGRDTSNLSRGRGMIAKHLGLGISLLLATGAAAPPDHRATAKLESFDRDPQWDALNNRLMKKPRTVTQDFGYDAKTQDIGGRLTRAMKPAYYAAPLETPKT